MPNTVLKNGKQKRNFIWKQVCKIAELLEPSLPRSPERPSLPRSPERHVTSRHDSRVPSPELVLGSCSPQVCWSSFYLCGSLWDVGHHILEMHTGASHNTLPPGWSAHSLYRTISCRKSLRSNTGFWCTLHISGSCLSIGNSYTGRLWSQFWCLITTTKFPSQRPVASLRSWRSFAMGTPSRKNTPPPRCWISQGVPTTKLPSKRRKEKPEFSYRAGLTCVLYP